MDLFEEILLGLSTGVISGIISSIIVTVIMTKRQKKYEVYSYWMQYLLALFDEIDIHIDGKQLDMLAPLGGQKSAFGKAIDEIESIRHPLPENRELTDNQQKIMMNFSIAMKELGEWKKKNKL